MTITVGALEMRTMTVVTIDAVEQLASTGGRGRPQCGMRRQVKELCCKLSGN